MGTKSGKPTPDLIKICTEYVKLKRNFIIKVEDEDPDNPDRQPIEYVHVDTLDQGQAA